MHVTSIDFSQKVVEMIDVVKKFGDFVANDRISLTVHKGEVHSLLGENGAGKTTLVNCLYGLYLRIDYSVNMRRVFTENIMIFIKNFQIMKLIILARI